MPTATQVTTDTTSDTEVVEGDPQVVGGRYRLEHELGRGGFAVTWRARDLQSGRAVAVKILSLRTVDHWKAIELFEREAKILRNLDHPQIPKYLDFIAPSEGDDRFVLVQELAAGRTLLDLIEGGWHPTEAEARAIADQLLGILEYLHGRSPAVVHRDIKPANIVRGTDGRIALIDFGSVRARLADTSQASTAGTFGYMAPEQLTGRAEPASDLYGLGATLVHLLSHRSPDQLPQRELRIDFRGAINVSPGFERWLARMLEPAPEQRFASAQAARSALHRADVVAGPRLGSFADERVAALVERDGLTVDIAGQSGIWHVLLTLGLVTATLALLGVVFSGGSPYVLLAVALVGAMTFDMGRRTLRRVSDVRLRMDHTGTTLERRLGKWVIHRRVLPPHEPTRLATRGILRKDLLFHTRGGSERLGSRLKRKTAAEIEARVSQAQDELA